MYVVIVGNPIDGFRIFGPFEDFESAGAFTEGVDESNWIEELQSP